MVKGLEIPTVYQNTPLSKLIDYQNFNLLHKNYSSAELIIITCMDYRINLNLPDNFAYIIRVAGANLQDNYFPVSYGLANTEIRHIAVIGHTDCAMIGLESKKEGTVHGMISKFGWDKIPADNYFDESIKHYEIWNERGFTLNETKKIRLLFPNIQIAPLIYNVDDGKLYFINEN